MILSILGVYDVLSRPYLLSRFQVSENDSSLSPPSLNVDLFTVYKDAKRLSKDYDLLFACLNVSDLYVFPDAQGIMLLNLYEAHVTFLIKYKHMDNTKNMMPRAKGFISFLVFILFTV